ncbi:hypothetical protein INR49_028880, partial [Caranx melampygus]
TDYWICTEQTQRRKQDKEVSDNDFTPCDTWSSIRVLSSVKSCLLEDLSEEQFENFKFYLQEDDILPGRQSLRLATLEKANRTKTVNLMVQNYKRDGALEMTKEVLRKINRNDLVETCSSAPRGFKNEDNAGDKIKAQNQKQLMKKSQEISCKNQHQREPETLLQRLHLPDKHQQKLSPADFLKVGRPVNQEHETSEEDLAHAFLQRLMMLDYRARYIPVIQDSAEVSHSIQT